MADRSRRDEPSTLEQLCASKEIIVSTGSGGVGKTTTAAALAATAATYLGLKVLVLTVDPARRLATALGMERFGNVETRVPAEAFEEAGVDPQGELWAAMLDTKQSWDDLIRQHAPDAETRDAILANPLYQNITGKFVQSHDYVAMERLYEIHTSGRYDLIVVDTPPTRNAVDFLDAPERMADFSLASLRWLIALPLLVGVAPFPLLVADRILGTQFEDIAEFFILFQSMYDGFVERADAVTGLLGSNVTSFVVVSTLEVAPAREAEYFLQLLTERRYHVGALVLNKTLPEFLLDRDATDSAKVLAKDAAKVAGELDGLVGDDLTPEQRRAHLTHVLGEVGSSFLDYQVVARREAEQRSELSAVPSLTCSIPTSPTTSTWQGLALGGTIWR